MFEWLHHLLNPHCPECESKKVCQTCDYLKQQLEIERQFNKVLFEKLTNKPTESVPINEPVPPAQMPKHIPWRVQKQMLEADDRKAAIIKQQREKEIASLEKEVIGEENASEVG